MLSTSFEGKHLPLEIRREIFKKKLETQALGDWEDTYITAICAIQREYHLSYTEIKNMPVSTFLILSEELSKFYKEQEKRMNKGKRSEIKTFG